MILSIFICFSFTADDDVNTDNILVSNPFKETWVTSPLTKFGRLVKTGNQATGNVIRCHPFCRGDNGVGSSGHPYWLGLTERKLTMPRTNSTIPGYLLAQCEAFCHKTELIVPIVHSATQCIYNCYMK